MSWESDMALDHLHARDGFAPAPPLAQSPPRRPQRRTSSSAFAGWIGPRFVVRFGGVRLVLTGPRKAVRAQARKVLQAYRGDDALVGLIDAALAELAA